MQIIITVNSFLPQISDLIGNETKSQKFVNRCKSAVRPASFALILKSNQLPSLQYNITVRVLLAYS